MDPRLVRRFVAEGKMPHCARLIAQGSFNLLKTSDPPQSPVAWSNFISGTNPGGHGIFDFIHRDPQTLVPFHSTSRAEGAGHPLRIGGWEIPLSPGKIQNRRRGATLWTLLEQGGIDCTVFRMPANFPPTETEATTLSGMGTPDVQGSYGIFTFYTDDPARRSRDVSGGRIERVVVQDNIARCTLTGPVNEFLEGKPASDVAFTVYLDPDRSLAKIAVQETACLLREGEWSEWVVVKFPMIPHVVEVSGICRFLLKRSGGKGGFGLYVSPVNIDPAHPSLPISTPPDYSRRLVRELGYYYTQGIVEDTHALSSGVLSVDEYRQQSTFAIDERMRFFEHEFGRFDRGFFFFYFSSLDLNSHMFWRALDPKHPTYNPNFAKAHGDFLPGLYAQIDKAVGQALQRIDERTLFVVMSDHGFTSFRRQFNLNSWLMDNGYVRPKRPGARGGPAGLLQDIDWTGTRAYGLGINGLYLNVKGREAGGIVSPGDRQAALCGELATRLKSVRDPETGQPVVSNVFRASDIYSGPYAGESPDLIVAYNENYRASWDTILGGFPREHVLDNTDAWSGDHCVDSQFVPGVLLSNRTLQHRHPALQDLAPTILTEFGVPVPAEITGRNLT